MAKRGKGKRGSGRSVSLLATLFGVTPAIYVLTTQPQGAASGALQTLLGGGGTWQTVALAAATMAQVVIQNWVSILIILVVAFIGVKLTHKLGRGARLTKHLRV